MDELETEALCMFSLFWSLAIGVPAIVWIECLIRRSRKRRFARRR